MQITATASNQFVPAALGTGPRGHVDAHGNNEAVQNNAVTAAQAVDSRDKQNAGQQENQTNKKGELTHDDHEMLTRRQNRDVQVRSHEHTHPVTTGRHASGSISYSYQIAPDGRPYAVGGHLNVDTSANRPRKKQSRRCRQSWPQHLHRWIPSPQDRQVAGRASATLAKARVEMAENHKTTGEALVEKGKESQIAPESDETDEPEVSKALSGNTESDDPLLGLAAENPEDGETVEKAADDEQKTDDDARITGLKELITNALNPNETHHLIDIGA